MGGHLFNQSDELFVSAKKKKKLRVMCRKVRPPGAGGCCGRRRRRRVKSQLEVGILLESVGCVGQQEEMLLISLG